MGTESEIHAFAEKWILKFNDPKSTYDDLAGPDLAGDCDALGFEMDTGKAFVTNYGDEADKDADRVKKLEVRKKDIPVLGSGIYSKWRYYNHWAVNPDEITEPAIRAWFVAVLEKLSFLTEEEKKPGPFFNGTPVKLKLKSNIFGYGPMPDPEEEVEQHLSVCSDGKIFLSSYAFGDGESHKRISARNYKVDPEKAQKVLTVIADYFTFYDPMVATDVGTWDMTLENEEGETYSFTGPEIGVKLDDGTELSQAVRDELDMQNLFLFDGDGGDRIDFIKIIYQPPKGKGSDYEETLTLDRPSETVTRGYRKADGTAVCHSYTEPGKVSALLDYLDKDPIFPVKEGGDAQKSASCAALTGTYTITVASRKHPDRTLSGNFCKNGLPEGYGDFIEAVSKFLGRYECSDLFNSGLYQKVFPKNGEEIYCSVIFDEKKKSYYYRTDDITLNVGDEVEVPVGPKNKLRTGRIVKIECFTKETAPLPLNQTKEVACKAQINQAIRQFNAKKTNENLSYLLAVLATSRVWIPCDTKIGEEDQEQLDEMVRSAGDDPDSLIGEEFTSKGDIHLVPDILKNGDSYFFPVFSSREEMGEYGGHFSKVPATFQQAIKLAKNNHVYELSGIVVNAFSNPFTLNWMLLGLLEKLTQPDQES